LLVLGLLIVIFSSIVVYGQLNGDFGLCDKNGNKYDDGALVGNEVCENGQWFSCNDGGEVKGYYYCDASESEWRPISECFAKNDYVDDNGMCEVNYCGMEINGPETIYTGNSKIKDVSLSGELAIFSENGEIYYCNVNDCEGSKIKLTSNSYEELNPKIQGNYVTFNRYIGSDVKGVICDINDCEGSEKVLDADPTIFNTYPYLNLTSSRNLIVRGDYVFKQQLGYTYSKAGTNYYVWNIAVCELNDLDNCKTNFQWVTDYNREPEQFFCELIIGVGAVCIGEGIDNGYYIYKDNILGFGYKLYYGQPLLNTYYHGYYNINEGINYVGSDWPDYGDPNDPRIFIKDSAPYGLDGAGKEDTNGYGKKIVYMSGYFPDRLGTCDLDNFNSCNSNQQIDLSGSSISSPKIYGNELLYKELLNYYPATRWKFHICDLMDCKRTNFTLYEENYQTSNDVVSQDIDGNIIVVAVNENLYKFEIKKVNSIDPQCDEVEPGQQGLCGVDNICNNMCQCELPPGCLLTNAYWGKDVNGNVPYNDGAIVANRTRVYLIQKGDDCTINDSLDIELWKKNPSGNDQNFKNITSNFNSNSVNSNEWVATWTFEGDNIPTINLSSYYFKTRFYYGNQNKQSGLLNVYKTTIADCGDGIIESDIGEICDYGAYPEDGCGVGQICSNLCSCIPKPDCKLNEAYWANYNNIDIPIANNTVLLNNTRVKLVQKGLYCDESDNIRYIVYEEDFISDTQLFNFTTSFNNDVAVKDWNAVWMDDGYLQGDPEYYFKTALISNGDGNKSQLIQVNETNGAVCGNNVFDEGFGEICDATDLGNNGCEAGWSCLSTCDGCYQDQGDNLTAFRIPNPCIDDGDGDDYGSRLVFYFVRNTTIQDPSEQGYIVRQWQQEEECIVPIGLKVSFFDIKTTIAVVLILIGYYLISNKKFGKLFKAKKKKRK